MYATGPSHAWRVTRRPGYDYCICPLRRKQVDPRARLRCLIRGNLQTTRAPGVEEARIDGQRKPVWNDGMNMGEQNMQGGGNENQKPRIE